MIKLNNIIRNCQIRNMIGELFKLNLVGEKKDRR